MYPKRYFSAELLNFAPSDGVVVVVVEPLVAAAADAVAVVVVADLLKTLVQLPNNVDCPRDKSEKSGL